MLNETVTADPSWIHPAELMDDDGEDDDAEALDVAGIGTIPKNALAVFCEFLLAKKRGSEKLNLRSTLARLLVLAHSLDVCEMRKISLTDLARRIGCTRALLSVYQVELRQFGQLSCHGGKSATARESYSRAASDAWTRRRARGGLGDGADVATRQGRTSCELGAS